MAVEPTFRNRVRVGGSGFTVFTFGGQPITFCQQVAHQTPQPVGEGVSAIHPMDEPYPIELITPAAAGMGQMTLNLFELFGKNGSVSKVWDRLGAPFGSTDEKPFVTNTAANASTNLSIGQGIFDQGNINDIVGIFIKQAELEPHKMKIVKYVRPLPTNNKSGSGKPYWEEYHGCVITNVVDGEEINVGTLEVIKQITVGYRYSTRKGNEPLAYQIRNRPL